MCPFEPRNLLGPQRKLSHCISKDIGSHVLVDISFPKDFQVTPEELCGLLRSSDALSLSNLKRIDCVEELEQNYGSVSTLCSLLHTSPVEGITDNDNLKQKRIQLFGTNVIPLKTSKAFWQLVLQALKEPTLVILEAAAIISLGLSLWNIFRPGAEKGASYEWIEAVAIAVAVLVIVLVTAVNDYGKERQFRTLQQKVREDHKVSVLRDGQAGSIPVEELVVGDICFIKYGDILPADGIVLQSQELKIDESSVTGESDSVEKDNVYDFRLLSGTHVAEGSGKMLVLAVGINSHTGSIYKLLGASADREQKHISDSDSSNDPSIDTTETTVTATNDKPKEKKEKTENLSVFQAKLTKLAERIGIVGLLFAAGTTVVLIIRFCVRNYGIEKQQWKAEDATTILDSVIIGITILVAAIPEGLPLAVTLTLAFSAKKMMRDNNLVRHLYACETMGCATTICSDKTGTLTTNRMTVTQSWFGEQIHYPLQGSIDPEFSSLLSTAIAINSSYGSHIVMSKKGGLAEQRGNKTECALLQLVTALGQDYRSLREAHPEDTFVKVFTFNSSRKSMSTVIRIPGGFRVFCKGAAEIVLSKCESIMFQSGHLVELSAQKRDDIINGVGSDMASSGLRTICVAYRDILKPITNREHEQQPFHTEDETKIVSNLTCLAVFGIEDPVRPEVPHAIRKCQRAGITVRMVTGDNIKTARSIAIKCGIIRPNDDSLLLEGEEFNRLVRDSSGNISQKLLDEIWPRLRVLARSKPEDKFNLVQGIVESRISSNREVVAVTGDGTNDAPALKKADVGFAMGIDGTDVAKEASDIILMDDNFISIVKSCMWGRSIYDNVAKFLQFQLTANVAALCVSIVSACVLGDTPLKAVPMLWINMIMDTLGCLALATETPTEALLQRKPYGRTKNLISPVMFHNILWQGAYQTIILLVMLFVGPSWFDLTETREIGKVVGEPSILYTMIFTTLVLMSGFNLINARCIHNEVNVFSGIFTNAYFAVMWLIMIFGQVIVVEFGGYAFATQPLSLELWMISLAFGVGSLLWYYVGLLAIRLSKCLCSAWTAQRNQPKVPGDKA